MGIFDFFTRRAPRADSTSTADIPVTSAGWMNPMTGLGLAGLDPTSSLHYQSGRLPSAMTVDKLYTFDWLADRIVEKMPSIAMVRGYSVPKQEPLLEEFEALNRTERFPRGAFERAVFDGRAYGGSVLWLGYNKGMPFTPLTDAHRAGGIAFFDVFGQHELRVLKRYDDPRSPMFGMPEIYQVLATASGMPHPRSGQIFHASRGIRFAGRPLRVPNTGIEVTDTSGGSSWPELGVSVLTPVLQDIGRYGLAWSAVSNMLQDASIGVMKLAGLVEALASEDKELIEDRLRTLQQTKSVHRMMFLDADNNEDYTRTEVSLTDVPAVMQQFMTSVAGAAETPASIFFSSSPTGLNANAKGEADLTQFYNTCANYQKYYLGPKLNTILAAVNGGQPVKVEWPSLWDSSNNEVAQTRLAHANATKVMWDMGVCEASDIVKAAQTNTLPELIGTPDDDRTALAGEPEDPLAGDPQGAPGKQQAAKIATKQRAEQK